MKKEKKGEREEGNSIETNALIENPRQRWTVCDCKKKEEKMWENRDIYRDKEREEDPSNTSPAAVCWLL